MFSHFFISRPKFAFVISILITLCGSISIPLLPIAEFPQISPEQVEVTAVYPGADAVTVANTVAAPIESKVNGVEGMIYMDSKSANDGTYTLNVTFELGYDGDMAQVNVNNRVQEAIAQLPEEVRRQGVKAIKKSTNLLMIINLFADGNEAMNKSIYLTMRRLTSPMY